MFHKHARAFCPQLADLLEDFAFDVNDAVVACSRAAKGRVSDDLRRLILCWALLRAYYGVSDETDDAADEDDYDQATDASDLPEATVDIAEATLRLFEKVSEPGLTHNEQTAIKSDLKRALKRQPYAPPWPVPSHDERGRRPRIFADLRISSFNRILERTN